MLKNLYASHPPALECSKQIVSAYRLLGLSTLYASAYFLPAVTPESIYFGSPNRLLRSVVVPSAVSIVVMLGVLYVTFQGARRCRSAELANSGTALVLSLLALIAIKGVFYCAFTDWRVFIPHFWDALQLLRDIKYATFFLVFFMIWRNRHRLAQPVRILASLGCAFGVLAIVRLVLLFNDQRQAFTTPLRSVDAGALYREAKYPRQEFRRRDGHSRRVVWIIFDETDLNPISASVQHVTPELKNFMLMKQRAIFATNANSPASATLYSVPALLTGTVVSGKGVRIDSRGGLLQQHPDGNWTSFGETKSVFSTLAETGQTASILGFYHPYCKLFNLQRCDSFPTAQIANWRSALVSNLPVFVTDWLDKTDRSEAITTNSLTLLPQYLVRDDALTFIHLNIPHPPANFADKSLHLAKNSDPIIEYNHNLSLTDRVLGDIMVILSREAQRHEILLVVSTDHWYRKMWYRSSEPETSRPIPFIVWRVGETSGIRLSQPLSTIHTSAMIVDYLNSTISTQKEIAQWWDKQPVSPSFIVPLS